MDSENRSSRRDPASKTVAGAVRAALRARAAHPARVARVAPVAWTALAALAPGLAAAGPAGEQVIAGDAAVSRPDAAGTVIDQASASAIIEWQRFSIDGAEYVRFNQPGTSAVALNRVVGADPSAILGTLTANGRVFLVNPHGVLFGPGSRVDVGGLVASVLDIADDDFLAGRYVFESDPDAPAPGEVVNRGRIEAADGGFVVLAGDYAANEGVISARLGDVVLAAGRKVTLDLDGDGLVQFAVDEAAVKSLAGVSNTGEIVADGGRVIMTAKVAGDLVGTAVNSAGVVRAAGIVESGGEIWLAGEGGDVVHGGTLDVSGRDGAPGGRVRIEGDGDVILAAGSRVLARGSGSAAGGEVHALAGAALEHRRGALIDVAGGEDDGAGGFVELSGDDLLFQGGVSLGDGGRLVLDPEEITIVDGSYGGYGGYGGPFGALAGTCFPGFNEICEGTLEDLLQTGFGGYGGIPSGVSFDGVTVQIRAKKRIRMQDLTDDVLDGTSDGVAGGPGNSLELLIEDGYGGLRSDPASFLGVAEIVFDGAATDLVKLDGRFIARTGRGGPLSEGFGDVAIGDVEAAEVLIGTDNTNSSNFHTGTVSAGDLTAFGASDANVVVSAQQSIGVGNVTATAPDDGVSDADVQLRARSGNVAAGDLTATSGEQSNVSVTAETGSTTVGNVLVLGEDRVDVSLGSGPDRDLTAGNVTGRAVYPDGIGSFASANAFLNLFTSTSGTGRIAAGNLLAEAIGNASGQTSLNTFADVRVSTGGAVAIGNATARAHASAGNTAFTRANVNVEGHDVVTGDLAADAMADAPGRSSSARGMVQVELRSGQANQGTVGSAALGKLTADADATGTGAVGGYGGFLSAFSEAIVSVNGQLDETFTVSTSGDPRAVADATLAVDPSASPVQAEATARAIVQMGGDLVFEGGGVSGGGLALDIGDATEVRATPTVTGFAGGAEQGEARVLYLAGHSTNGVALEIGGPVTVTGPGAKAELVSEDPGGGAVNLNAPVTVTKTEDIFSGGYGGGVMRTIVADGGSGPLNIPAPVVLTDQGPGGGHVVLRGEGPITLDGAVIAIANGADPGVIEVELLGGADLAGAGRLQADKIGIDGSGGGNDVRIATTTGALLLEDLHDVTIDNQGFGGPATLDLRGGPFGDVAIALGGPGTFGPVALFGPCQAGTVCVEGQTGRDAGDLPFGALSAEAPGGGPLTAIEGVLEFTNDVDFYEIFIEGGGGFSADVEAEDLAGGLRDSMIFLFDTSGVGIVRNDDDFEFGCCDSRLPLGSSLLAGLSPGPYLLAVSSFSNDPFNDGGTIFRRSAGEGFSLVVPDPAQPTTLEPLTGFQGDGGSFGFYRVALTGARFFDVPPPGPPDVVAESLVVGASGDLGLGGSRFSTSGLTNFVTTGTLDAGGASLAADTLVVNAGADVLIDEASIDAGAVFLNGVNVLNSPGTTIRVGGNTIPGVEGDRVLLEQLGIAGVPVGGGAPNFTAIARGGTLDLSGTTMDLTGSARYLWLQGDTILAPAYENVPTPVLVQMTPFTLTNTVTVDAVPAPAAPGFTSFGFDPHVAGLPNSPLTTVAFGHSEDPLRLFPFFAGDFFVGTFAPFDAGARNLVFIAGGQIFGPGAPPVPGIDSIGATSTGLVTFIDLVLGSESEFEVIQTDEIETEGEVVTGIVTTQGSEEVRLLCN